MTARIAVRYVSRRLSSSGKILSEEEKAAENIYIKKTEQDELHKLAHKGPKAEESSTNSGGSTTDAKPSAAESASSAGVSSDKNRNYAVIAGMVVIAGVAGRYLRSNAKKSEVQN